MLLSLTHPEGKLDVDAMLEGMTQATFERWYRYYQMAPWGEDYKRTSAGVARIVNTIISTAQIEKVTDDMFMEPDELVPKWYAKGESPQEKEIEAQCEAADSLEGFGV